MSKFVTTPKCAGIFISDADPNWRPTQVWLAEATRMVTARMFAQTLTQNFEKKDAETNAVHKAAITSQVSKVFGALFDESAPSFSISWIVDLLVQLQDLADIGFGYHIPRESRIVRLANGWGRIAGGLPLELSEHPEGGIKSVLGGTIGRLVKFSDNFDLHDQNPEHSKVFQWMSQSIDTHYSRLCEQLPDKNSTRPPEDGAEYYNAQYQRARTRGERWQNKLPDQSFVVARTRGLPIHYYVFVPTNAETSKGWFEVTHEEARNWILLAEKRAGTTNQIRVTDSEIGSTLHLPDMLPAAWTVAIFSCASTVVPVEKNGWIVEVQKEARDLVEMLLRGANILLI
jgi:hypothetical protein